MPTAKASPASGAKQPDWELIERDYRAGLLSVREIAASQGLTHGAINKRAKRDSWERDLKAKIKAKADALVSKREVSTAGIHPPSKEQLATERSIVDANASRIADIRLAHRKDISRGRKLAMALLEELETETGNVAIFEELGELLRREDDKGIDRLNDIYRKVISSTGRVDSMKKLADTLKTLIGIEREAYGITTEHEDAESAANAAIARAKVVIVPQKMVASIETRPLGQAAN